MKSATVARRSSRFVKRLCHSYKLIKIKKEGNNTYSVRILPRYR